jgi:hypothetical protein
MLTRIFSKQPVENGGRTAHISPRPRLPHESPITNKPQVPDEPPILEVGSPPGVHPKPPYCPPSPVSNIDQQQQPQEVSLTGVAIPPISLGNLDNE